MKLQFPFVTGDSTAKDIQPGAKSPQPLAAGRWTLSPKSTVPYATVDTPHGAREFTWGDLVEIPESSQGAVSNSSVHSGDIIFSGIGTGTGANMSLPGQLTIPANLFSDTVNGRIVSRVIDTRRARRAYLCLPTAQLGGSVRMTINYRAPRRGNPYGTGTVAMLSSGVQTYVLRHQGYIGQLPLGIGSGQNQEVGAAPNSLAETRPMAMLDELFIYVATADAAFLGMGATTDAFFLLEY